MTKHKITYSKMTFILSIIGFIGSIGFYIGVLRQVYRAPNESQLQLMELKKENEQLKNQVNTLTLLISEHQEK